jgi:hypothetical protein
LRIIKDLLIERAIKSRISQVDTLEYDNSLVTEQEQEKEIAVKPEFGKTGLIFNSYRL